MRNVIDNDDNCVPRSPLDDEQTKISDAGQVDWKHGAISGGSTEFVGETCSIGFGQNCDDDEVLSEPQNAIGMVDIQHGRPKSSRPVSIMFDAVSVLD